VSDLIDNTPQPTEVSKPTETNLAEGGDVEELEPGSDEAEGAQSVEADSEGEPDQQPAKPAVAKWVGDDGAEYEVPETILPALMKDRDYRQKTAAVAQQRREIEEAKAAFEVERQRSADELKIEAELAHLTELERQYAGLDWSRMAQEDLYTAQQRQFERQQVKDRIATLSGERAQKVQERTARAQQETAKRVEAAENYGRANIPNWDAGADRQLVEYARSVGFDDATLARMISPAFIKLLHEASIGASALKKAAVQPKPELKKAEPAKQVNGRSNGSGRKPLHEMSMDEYAAYRNAREARK
jgi:hypothetical protein